MSFIKDLLYFINEVGELLPQTKGHYRPISKMHYPTYHKSLMRLESAGLIKRKNNAVNQTVFSITVAGKRILKKPPVHIKRNDGFSTLVCFDIPEKMRRERNIFRRYLLRNGYNLIQKSILISPNKMNQEILDLIKELRLPSFVKIISGKIDYLL